MYNKTYIEIADKNRNSVLAMLADYKVFFPLYSDRRKFLQCLRSIEPLIFACLFIGKSL